MGEATNQQYRKSISASATVRIGTGLRGRLLFVTNEWNKQSGSQRRHTCVHNAASNRDKPDKVLCRSLTLFID